jgi:phosphopantothenoylcysteine decarboxylase/phosphopantothenate--cysteine ligase
MGRMLEPEELLEDIVAVFQPKVLAGRKVVITAGPTFEAMDPIRGITNHSSGKMGFAIARAAREAGAEVALVAGPVAVATPRGGAPHRREVRPRDAGGHRGPDAGRRHLHRRGRRGGLAAGQRGRPEDQEGRQRHAPVLAFTENPDILATVAQGERRARRRAVLRRLRRRKPRPGEARQGQARAQGHPAAGGQHRPLTFGQDDNQMLLVDAQGAQELPRASKIECARQLVAEIARRLHRAAEPNQCKSTSRSSIRAWRTSCPPMPRPAAPAWTCGPASMRRSRWSPMPGSWCPPASPSG